MNVFSAIRARLNNANPAHHAIARGMAWVAFFVFLGKLAGAAKEMAIAYRYGVNAEVDAYIFVSNLVLLPVGLWFTVLSFVLLPLVAHIRQEASVELPRFRAELFGVALMLGLALALLTWIGLPLLLRSSWTGLPPTTVPIAAHMAPVLVLLLPLGVLISLFSAWMLVAGRHANTLLEGVPALTILVALLAFPSGGVEALVWGTVAGFVFHLISLAVPLGRRGEIDAPRFIQQSPQWPVFWQGFGIMLAGQSLMSFIGIIDQFFAAHLGTGAIATLNYASRILALILGLGATAVSRATLPVFSKAQTQGGGQLSRVSTQWMLIMFVVGIISLIIGLLLAPWAVKILFERGAFMARDTQTVVEVFRYSLVQLPFYFAYLVLVSLLVSQGRYQAIATVACVNLITKVAANFGLVPWLGINGLVLATAFMYMVSMFLCWHTVRYKR